MTLFKRICSYVFSIVMLFSFSIQACASNDTQLTYPTWLNHIAQDFNIEIESLLPMYNAGMTYRQIREKMYESVIVEDILPEESDFLSLAAEKEVDRWDAVKAYELAVKYKKEPSWLIDIYKEYEDWDTIEHALNRYEQVENSLTSALASSGQNYILQNIGSIYNVNTSFLMQLYSAFTDIEDFKSVMFLYDLNKEDTGFITSMLTNVNDLIADAILARKEVFGIKASWPQFTIDQSNMTEQTSRSSDFEHFSFSQQFTQPQFMLKSLTDEPSDIQTDESRTSTENNMFDMGIIYDTYAVTPFKSYFNGSSESVDPLTGELTVVQTDFTLPGKYGMDFNFTRINRSSQAFLIAPATGFATASYSISAGSTNEIDTYRQENPDGTVIIDVYSKNYTYPSQTSKNGMAIGTLTETLTRSEGYIDQFGVDQYQNTQQISQETYQNVIVQPASENISPFYLMPEEEGEISVLYRAFGFGVGWTLDMPVLEIQADRKYIHLGLEGTYKVGTDGYLERRNINDLKVQADTSYIYNNIRSAYSLQNIDGTVWYFNSSGKAIAKKDKYDSYIRYFYNDKGYIDNIVDTVGRNIRFTYTYSGTYTLAGVTCYCPATITVNVYDSTATSAQVLFSWIYNMVWDDSKEVPYMSSVQPPTGPSITYLYKDLRPSLSWYYGSDPYSFNSNYKVISSIIHPNGLTTSYTLAYNIWTGYVSDQYGEVSRGFPCVYGRQDVVPTDIVSSTGNSLVDKQENKASFSYVLPTEDNPYYIGTRTASRLSGESGIVPAVEIFKYDTDFRLVEHDVTTQNGDIGLNKSEKIVTTYEYDAQRKSLPIKKTVKTTVDNRTSTKVHTYTWDSYGNQILDKDYAGYMTIYEYEPTYNMLTKKTEFMTPNSTTGKSKITEYELSSDKKSVISSKETVVNQSSTVQRSVSGPLGEIEDELIFAPAMPVKSFSTVIEMTIDIFESSGKYTVSYRKVGVGEWTLVEKGTVNIFPSFETEYVKTVNYTFPSNDFYEIKIERQDSKTFNIQELNAYYDEIVATDVTEVIKTLEYDTNHPGNVVAVNTHQIVSGSPSSVLPSVESRTIYQYDSAYNADLVKESTTVTDVDGIQSVISTEAQYDRLGRITSVTRQSSQDLSSSQTSMEYDLLGRLTKVINPSHDDTTNTSYVSYAYLDTQRKIRITDELGTVREETYDGMDRLITSSWIDSNQSKIISHNRYDSVGDLVSSFDGKFNETKYEYDAFGRNTKVIYPDLTYTTTQYSEVYTDPLAVPSLWFEAPSVISGLPLDGWIRVFGAAGESVYYGYDILGRTVVTASNPNSSPQNGSLRWSFVWHEYDRYDRITKTAVQRQQNVWDTTEYGYRYPISAPSSIDLPGDTEPIHVYEYNSKGLMTKEYDVNTVNITSYQYDELGRLKRIDYPNNITAKYKSDKFGNTISAQLLKNGITESVVTFDYNKRNWLESQQWTIGTNSYTISHEYDAAGNRKKTVYPDNVEVSFDYDQLGRIVKIPGLFESADSVNIQNKGFVYDDAGNLLNTYAANGINTMYSYNTKNNVTNISSTPLTLSYSYNNSGNVISVIDSTTGMTPMTLQYTYDKAGQLKTAQVIRDNAVQTLSYWYDGAGNRIYETLTDTANQLLSSYQYSYLPGNYLSQKTGQSNLSYTWGQFGQLTYKSTGEQYVYDSTKSLISVQNGATQTTNYKYDALGNRIQITENGTTTTVLTSGNDSVYEIVAPSAGDVTTSKYITVNGKHLAKIIKEGSQEAEAFFHHIDLTGSIRAVTDSEGQVVKRYEYDPFGYVSRSSGSGEETHQFTGKRADTGTGLTYFGSRYYDPEIGRFISSDPARWGTNWYVYCYNNPISYIDPNGMKPENASAVLQQSKYTTQYDTYKFAREGYITVTGIVASVLTLDSSTIGDVARKMGWLVLTSLYVEDFYDDISVNNTNPYLVDPLQYVRFLEEAEVLYNQYVKQAETIRATLDVMYEENFLDYETMKIMREMMVEAETNANQLAIEIEANFNALEQLRQDSFGMWTGR